MSISNTLIGKSEDPSTATLPGKELHASATVFFDGNCRLCRDLAHFMGRLADLDLLQFKPSLESDPQSIKVEVKDEQGRTSTLQGRDAWQWLIANHPSIRPLHWIAVKLGLASSTATAVQVGAGVLRRLCFRCKSY